MCCYGNADDGGLEQLLWRRGAGLDLGYGLRSKINMDYRKVLHVCLRRKRSMCILTHGTLAESIHQNTAMKNQNHIQNSEKECRSMN